MSRDMCWPLGHCICGLGATKMRYIQHLLCTGGTGLCKKTSVSGVISFWDILDGKQTSRPHTRRYSLARLGDFLLQITSPSMTEIQHQLIHIKTKTGDSPYQREQDVFEQYHWPVGHFALTPWEFILYIYIYHPTPAWTRMDSSCKPTMSMFVCHYHDFIVDIELWNRSWKIQTS